MTLTYSAVWFLFLFSCVCGRKKNQCRNCKQAKYIWNANECVRFMCRSNNWVRNGFNRFGLSVSQFSEIFSYKIFHAIWPSLRSYIGSLTLALFWMNRNQHFCGDQIQRCFLHIFESTPNILVTLMWEILINRFTNDTLNLWFIFQALSRSNATEEFKKKKMENSRHHRTFSMVIYCIIIDVSLINYIYSR